MIYNISYGLTGVSHIIYIISARQAPVMKVDISTMKDEEVRTLQEQAMKQLEKDMARAEVLADPVRIERKLLAGQLARARYKKKLSQGELAAKIGMEQPQISNIENARGNPTLDTLLKIARALDVHLVVE
jgi:ribosome-binding protein aMBF1 (putative translation factor)